MDSGGEKFVYKIVSFLHRVFKNLSINLSEIARKLYKIKYLLEFGERDDDIYIVTFPKSGTTMMQMMLYQLTTDGNMDFDHIYDVSPWISNDAFEGRKPKDFPSPRIIKTHDYYEDFDRETKGKFIMVYRNGMDVAVSLYHQNKAYNHIKLNFEEFVEKFINPEKLGFFEFHKGWFENKHGFPILYLRYEDLVDNFDISMKKVIQFCGIKIAPSELDRVKERCSFEFMKKHEEKFGEQPPKKEKIYNEFIRKGKKGEGKKYFNEEQKMVFHEKYKKELKNLEPSNI